MARQPGKKAVVAFETSKAHSSSTSSVTRIFSGTSSCKGNSHASAMEEKKRSTAKTFTFCEGLPLTAKESGSISTLRLVYWSVASLQRQRWLASFPDKLATRITVRLMV